MVKLKSFFNKEAGRFFLQLAIILIITYSLTNFIGLSRGGFESREILELQTFYIIGGVFALILMLLFLYQISTSEGDDIYGRGVGFSNLGGKPHIPIFKRFSTLQLGWLFVIVLLIFGALNILGVFGAQRTYTGVGVLETQQFTPTDSLIYSTLLIPGSENFGFAVLAGILIVTLGILARKYKLKLEVYVVLVFISMIVLGGLFGLGNHQLRYRGSDVALQTVIVFWSIGGLLTALTGSFVFFWLIHIFNNFLFDLSRFLSVDSIIAILGSSLFVLVILYVVVYRGRLLGSKKNSE
jgi:hypothetical protein